MTLTGIWTPAAEFVFHIECHYTTDPWLRWDILKISISMIFANYMLIYFCFSFLFDKVLWVAMIHVFETIGSNISIEKYFHSFCFLISYLISRCKYFADITFARTWSLKHKKTMFKITYLRCSDRKINILLELRNK